MKKILSVVMVIAMLFALSATAFAEEQSPVPTDPPLLENKEVTGGGKTAGGLAVKVDEWDPEGTPFKDAAAAAKDAAKSPAFEDLKEKLGLDDEDIGGTSLLCADIEGEDPITVVLFYSPDGDPVAGLYYCGSDKGNDESGDWYEVEVEKTEDGGAGEYTLTLKPNDDGKGLDAKLEVTITDKP